MLHSTRTDVPILPQRADNPQVGMLLNAFDINLAGLYPPEANQAVSVQELLAPEEAFFAAWQGDRIVGTGAVRRMSGSNATASQPYGEVKRMFVKIAQRGEGVGQRLLQALERELRGYLTGRALLETRRDQHEALHPYQRCAHVSRSHFGGYPDNGLSRFFEKRV